MEYAIGYRYDRIKRRKYKAFRNRFNENTSNPMWDGLVTIEYAEKYICKDGMIDYCVTRKGLDFLERILDIIIEED